MLTLFRRNQRHWIWTRVLALVETPGHSLRAVYFRASLRLKRLLTGRQLVLFKRPSGIGDIICTFPALAQIKQRHPDAFWVYGTSAAFADVVRMSGLVDLVAQTDWPCRIAKVSPRTFDWVYEPRLESEQGTGPSVTHLVDDFARQLNITLVDRQPRLHISPEARRSISLDPAFIGEADQPIITIHTGPTWPVKEWPTSAWGELVGLLRSQLNATVIQIGNDRSTSKGPQYTPRIPGTIDRIARFSLEETSAAISLSDTFIGIDSGLLHIAGAVSTPCVGIFGPTEPALILPTGTRSEGVAATLPCSGCHHDAHPLHWEDNCPHSIACMRAIDPAAVLLACQKVLRSARKIESVGKAWETL